MDWPSNQYEKESKKKKKKKFSIITYLGKSKKTFSSSFKHLEIFEKRKRIEEEIALHSILSSKYLEIFEERKGLEEETILRIQFICPLVSHRAPSQTLRTIRNYNNDIVSIKFFQTFPTIHILIQPIDRFIRARRTLFFSFFFFSFLFLLMHFIKDNDRPCFLAIVCLLIVARTI